MRSLRLSLSLKVWLHVLFIIAGAVLSLWIAGCTERQTRFRTVDGIKFEERIDWADNPCGNRGPQAGCHVRLDGKHVIYYSSVAPAYVFLHELAHSKGMKHTEWDGKNCAIVTAPGGTYKVGQQLCIIAGREVVTEPLASAAAHIEPQQPASTSRRNH